MRKIHVVVERDSENWWLADVPQIPGCHTQGRTIEQTLHRVKEALEVCDVDVAQIELVPDIKLPSKARVALAAISDARAKARREQEKAQQTVTRAAQILEAMGVSRRDAGRLLDLSHQRVQQLLSSKART